MASLTSLPNEVLSDILEYVHNASESSNDLHSLLLVARRISRVAKDILYKAPRLLKPKPDDCVSWHLRRAHQVRGLLRTVITRPDLAKQIYQLDLTVVLYRRLESSQEEPNEQPGSTRQYHCPNDEVFDLDSTRVKNMKQVNSSWKNQVRAGLEPAMAGLILALAPSLKHLMINSFLKHPEPPLSESPTPDLPSFESLYSAQSLTPLDWFGRHPNFDLSSVAGLAHLISLRCTGLVPRPVMIQPSLRSLDIATLNFAPDIPLDLLMPLADDSAVGNLVHLTLHAGCTTIHEEFPMAPGFPTPSHVLYLTRLTRCFPALIALHLVVDGNFMFWLDAGYNYTIERIDIPNLQILTIDTRGVKGDGVGIHKVTGITQLTRLPRLRRIVAPHDAFVTNGCFQLHAFASVESMEVIDPPEDFIRCMLDTMADDDCLPNLSAVVVWREHEDDNAEPGLALHEVTLSWIERNNIFIGLAVGTKGWMREDYDKTMPKEYALPIPTSMAAVENA